MDPLGGVAKFLAPFWMNLRLFPTPLPFFSEKGFALHLSFSAIVLFGILTSFVSVRTPYKGFLISS